MTDKHQPPQRGAFAMFGALTGIATLSAVLVVGGAVLGLLVDGWTSAPHVFVFVGLVLGVAGRRAGDALDRQEVLPMSDRRHDATRRSTTGHGAALGRPQLQQVAADQRRRRGLVGVRRPLPSPVSLDAGILFCVGLGLGVSTASSCNARSSVGDATASRTARRSAFGMLRRLIV